MRALIMVAAAALAVSACSDNAAENTTNLDEMTTENVVVDNTMDANMDANMSMNGDVNITTNGDVNVTDGNATANNAM